MNSMDDYSGSQEEDFNPVYNNDFFLPDNGLNANLNWEENQLFSEFFEFDGILNLNNPPTESTVSVKDEKFLPEDLDINIEEINHNDSGFSSDNTDLRLNSPNFDTHTTGVSSPDTLDAVSDVSSTSDLGSMASVSSPARSHQDTSLVLDFPPTDVSKGSEGTNEKLIFIPASNDNVLSGQQKMKVELPQNDTSIRSISLKSVPPKQPIVVSPPANFISSGGQSNGLFNGQTIVVTQAPKGSASLLRKSNTYLKTVSNGKSVYVPVNVKDINQVRSFKVINGSTNNSPQLKNGVRIISPAHTVPSQNKSISPKTMDGRPILKVGPTSIATTRYPSVCTTVKDDDDAPQNGQEVKLTDEERRLLKKEQIVLPTHYPLSKQEDRDLKRIKRKIRNKISAQDSRKRKKEYVDNLEAKVIEKEAANAKLEKKVHILENQNEYLTLQLNRLKNMLGNGGNRQSAHSTALMMLILSAALIVIPSLRPQDAREGELSVNNSPPSGQTRTLLEAGVPLVLGTPEVEEEISIDEQEFTALSDHDYAPLAKRPKLESPFYPEFEMLDKKTRSEGEPPDGMASFFAAFFNRLSKNWTDPNQMMAKEPNKIPVGFNTFANHPNTPQSVVVNLNGKGKLLEELELE